MRVRRAMICRNVSLVLIGLALVSSDLAAQAGFQVTSVSVNRRALLFDSTEYSVNSVATYPQSGWMDRDASQETTICLNGTCNQPWGHTIQGPFSPGQTFVCGGSSRSIFDRYPCQAKGVERNPPCSYNGRLQSTAEVVTTGGVWQSYYSWGGTNEWLTCTPVPPPLTCGGSYGLTDYHHMDLNGGVSVIRSMGVPARPLYRTEKVDGRDYYKNEFLIADRDPTTGEYGAIAFSDGAFAAEGTKVLNQSSPPGIGPEKVFLVQGAEHPRTETWMPPPHASFGDGFESGRGSLVSREFPTRDEGDGVSRPESDATWRFLARFDVRETGARTAEVLWTEKDVDSAWLSTLKDAMELSGSGQHRVVVYALVEVGGTVRVAQRTSFMPKCCCGEVLCI